MVGTLVHTYRYSVYGQIVCMALNECGHPYEVHEVDPFSESPEERARNPHPFGLVPTVDFGGFRVFETSAILHHINTTMMAGHWFPTEAKTRTRVIQTVAICDAHGYWPLVRQVFGQGFFRPHLGMEPDQKVFTAGMRTSRLVLLELENIATEARCLTGADITLADLHLAPMLGYFAMVHEGRKMLRDFPSLENWLEKIRVRDSYVNSRPSFSDA